MILEIEEKKESEVKLVYLGKMGCLEKKDPEVRKGMMSGADGEPRRYAPCKSRS